MTETLATPVLPVVRVAILAGGRMAEMALPAELPLREILPAVQRLLRSGSHAAENIDAAETTRLSLAPIGGAPFSLDATLDTVGVVDGDLLALQPIPVGPAAPGIVEDIADAANGNLVFPGSKSGPVLVLTNGPNFAVSNVGPFGHLDEWGSVNNPPYAPLRRAVEASGLEFH